MKKGNEEVPRQSNIELLRIIAMLMIVAHHFAVHGNFNFSTETVSVNRLWIQFFHYGGKIGVDIFVLISGYFLVNAKFKLNKLMKLWIQMFTYSVLFYLIFAMRGGRMNFDVVGFVRCLFPITYSHWWFASAYFMLYLFLPYINRFLHTLEQESYQRLLVLMTCCWCIIPTILAYAWQCNDLLWFIYLYAVAGYYRIYHLKQKIKGRTCIVAAFALTAFAFLVIMILDCIGKRFSFVGIHALFFSSMQRFPVPAIAFFMFAVFEKIQIPFNKFINIISSATFGVYLIHDDSNVREYIWKGIFKNALFSESSYLIPYSILVIFLVYVVCTVIELLRIYYIEKHYMSMIDKTIAIANKYGNIFRSGSR